MSFVIPGVFGPWILNLEVNRQYIIPHKYGKQKGRQEQSMPRHSLLMLAEQESIKKCIHTKMQTIEINEWDTQEENYESCY